MQTNFFTERLLLGLIDESDYNFIIALVNSEGWLKFIGNRNIQSKDDAIGYINKIKSTPNFYYWVVWLKHTNTPIGIISFLKRGYLDFFDIGFAFLPEFNGKGYAFEAAQTVLSHLIKSPNIQLFLRLRLLETSHR